MRNYQKIFLVAVGGALLAAGLAVAAPTTDGLKNHLNYIDTAEVQKVCRQRKIRDWTKLTGEDVSILPEEAQIILKEINVKNLPVPLEEFQEGLRVELEHGLRYPEANVTNNHPLLVGKIALAHLNESLDYYQRLNIMEMEAELTEEIGKKNWGEVQTIYKSLLAAKEKLARMEAKRFSSK